MVSCTHCGESGHNQRTCKNKLIPFSISGYWWEETWGGQKAGFPLADGSHAAMITKIVGGEPLKEPNSARWPEIDYPNELLDMTWGELKQKIKDDTLHNEVKLGDANYSIDYIDKTFRYLPTDTVLSMRNGENYPIEIRFNYKGQDYGVILAPRKGEWGAEEYGAEDTKMQQKIGETVAWKGSIIGMSGKWRDGIYDIFQILAAKTNDPHQQPLGYTIIHQDASWKFRDSDLGPKQFNVNLGKLGTDVGEITFAGMSIGTGGDGSWPLWGAYESIKDYYARTQNKPQPAFPPLAEESYSYTEEWRQIEELWRDGFFDWCMEQTDETHQTYYNNGSPVKMDTHTARSIAENKHKLLVGARLGLHNPIEPTITTENAKRTFWRIRIPSIIRQMTDGYGRTKRDKTYRYVNTEKTLNEYFDNLKSLYPDGNFQEDAGSQYRAAEKSFTIKLPAFGRYQWSAREYVLGYASPSMEEIKRNSDRRQAKLSKEMTDREEKKKRERKEKYGAEDDSCCCGATKSHPCACMIQGIENCSATCPCSLEKKNAESFEAQEGGWKRFKENHYPYSLRHIAKLWDDRKDGLCMKENCVCQRGRMKGAEGRKGNWEDRWEDKSVYCPNCKWEGLESELDPLGSNYLHYCPECKRKDWEYTTFNAESEDYTSHEAESFSDYMKSLHPDASHHPEHDWQIATEKRPADEWECMNCGVWVSGQKGLSVANKRSCPKKKDFGATKGIDTFTQPFEESSLDSGTAKSVVIGLVVGGLALFGYNKWK